MQNAYPTESTISDAKGIWSIELKILEKLKDARPLASFSERDQFTIEGLIRKSLVIKIGDHNPRVIANEL